MNLQYTLTENDYIAFNRSHYSRSPTMRGQFFRSRIYMSGVFFFLPVLLVVTLTEFTYLWAGFAAGFMVAFLIYRFYPKFYWKMIERNLRKFLRKQDPSAPFEKPASISLEDDGMHFSIGSNESVSPYSSINDIVHENGAVYIYVDALQGSIIPAGVYGTDEFVSELKAKLPSHS